MARKSKSGNGEGNIRQRADGTWEARISLDRGRRKSLYGKTRQEVASKLASATRDRDKGLPLAQDERQTVASYLAMWLPTIKATVAPSTYERYEEQIRLHIVPALGSLRLSKLTPQRLQVFYAECQEAALASASVAHIHAVLHRALDAAVKLGVLLLNVADNVTAPRPSSREMHPLNREQSQALLAAVQGERLEALYVLALTSGMRQGELLALRWQDVNMDTGYVHIQHTLHHTGGGAWVLAAPKTQRSRRRIHLTVTAIEALRRHKARQNQERLTIGPAWVDHDFVFTRQDGHPLRGIHVYQRDLQPLLRRAGLPAIRFHDLRHTAATLLLLQDVHAKVVSELLGHSSAAITMDRYSHVLPTMQRDAAEAMDRALGAV